MLERRPFGKPAAKLEETTLVEHAKAGSQQAQYIIYKRYVDAMFHTVVRMVGNTSEALMATTAGLSKRQQIGQPVHTWKLADLPEAGSWTERYQRVEQIMSTDLFTVLEEDLIEYVANIMDWRNIRHLLVENEQGQFTGIVNSKNLVRHFAKKQKRKWTRMCAGYHDQ